jgi:hypothetical protein
MEAMIENMKSTVQETLDELFYEQLIPFKLTAYEVDQNGFGEYVVPFYDSRLHSVNFSCDHRESFKGVVRAAVLEQTKRMSGR